MCFCLIDGWKAVNEETDVWVKSPWLPAHGRVSESPWLPAHAVVAGLRVACAAAVEFPGLQDHGSSDC